MKRLIDTQNVKETLFREEKELARMFFNMKEYPIGFITGVQESMNIANITYARSQDIESVINELQARVEKMNNTPIKSGYYFILSYIHYINDDLILSLLASKCIIASYKLGVLDND